jgi:hypothetical protein
MDTSGVKVPAELLELTERLADNVHEVWAAQKVKDGWSYGPTVDAATKKHPDLMPYAQLQEEKKVYDRDTAMETIKLILSLGYTILPPGEKA